MSNPGRHARLRVALDTTFAGVNPTGVGLYSRRLCEALVLHGDRLGIIVECFGPSCSGPAEPLFLNGLYHEWPPYTQVALPAKLRGMKPQIVHSTSHLGPLWGPGRKVVTVHDLIFLRRPGDYSVPWLAVTRILLPAILSRAAAIITDSVATRREVVRHFPGVGHKTFVVYPGIDSASKQPRNRQEESRILARHSLEDGNYVICLGPWTRRKNVQSIVRAFGLLADEFPRLKLVVTGERTAGMEADDVLNSAARSGAAGPGRIITPGHLNERELAALVKCAAVLAYPSLMEGFGLPPLEAMSAGVPAVVSDAASVVEAVGDAAITVPARAVRAWAMAISALLRDPTLRTKMVHRGLERSAQFSWERCARETVGVYRKAL